MYLYLAICSINYPYLEIFALNCHDFTKCAIFILDSILLLRLQNCRAIGQLFMDILRFKELGDTENVVTNAVCSH